MTRFHHKAITDPGGWREHAACRDVPTDVFFVDRGEDVSTARAVCRSCPVVLPCREYAVVNNLDDGIWGDTSPDERKAIRRARRKAQRGAA